MIIYNPLDGEAITTNIPGNLRHCFLMTRLGQPIPPGVERMRHNITAICREADFRVIDASSRVTGRDFLNKIWRLIASAPLSVGICHEEIPPSSQANIWYELGVAQAMGKETVIIKSRHADIPSDFVRTEYISYDDDFDINFTKFLTDVDERADHYELVADQLEKNPVLAIDYLKRAYLISGNTQLRTKVQSLIKEAGLERRAKNSVEFLAASF